MRPGTKPKPTPLKILSGVKPGRINQNEPKASGVPQCPPHLDAEARAEWERRVPELDAMGLLASVYCASLAAYCSAWSQWVYACGKITETGGAVLTSDVGNLYQNPWTAERNKSWEQMMKSAAEFGMSPSSISRVNAEKKVAGSGKSRFFAG